MRIAQIAPICFSLPPTRYGGIELIVNSLTESLVKRGHEVTLFSTGDSKTKAKLKYLFKKALGWGKDSPEYCLAAANFAFQDTDNFDIIHNHMGYYGLPFSRYSKAPVITTLHNDIHNSSREFLNFYKDVCTFIAISRNQMKRVKSVPISGYIHNGIDMNGFQYDGQKEDYLLFIGNISKEKGADVAVKASIKLQKKLLLVGKVDAGNRLFFEKEIKPYIDNKQIVFKSLADHTQKQALYGKAACLLFPVNWEEPFGLVMVEAMACGTPVIAFDRGSVPEIIDNGKTGFVVDSFNEFVTAIQKVNQLNPRDCRTHVEKYFDVEKMTDHYEQLYLKLIKEKNSQILS